MAHPIEYLKGVGPQRADLLKKELAIFTFNDLLHHFPYRHIDKTKILKISDLSHAIEFGQVQGIIAYKEVIGEKNAKRLVAYLRDETGIVELTWFKGISWMEKILKEGEAYTAFGRVSFFSGNPQIVHPEVELKVDAEGAKAVLEPVYSTTEKLKARGLGGRQIGKLVYTLLGLLSNNEIPENLPQVIIDRTKVIDRLTAYYHIHFPKNQQQYNHALRRLKFEELFISQLRLALIRSERHRL